VDVKDVEALAEVMAMAPNVRLFYVTQPQTENHQLRDRKSSRSNINGLITK